MFILLTEKKSPWLKALLSIGKQKVAFLVEIVKKSSYFRISNVKCYNKDIN